MSRSAIPYLDVTWSPTTGCTPISPGCDHCWARSMLRRFGKTVDAIDPVEPQCHPERLSIPAHWRKPKVVGVSFLGDLVHPRISPEFVCEVLDVMRREYKHTFIVLTKRPRLLLDALGHWADHGSTGLRDCPNIWIGVSVEDQKTADERIPLLLEIPAAHKWVSVEPQLGDVDLHVGLRLQMRTPPPTFREEVWWKRLGPSEINWVVCGCESGPARRPFDENWARTLRDQCTAAGVPFFYKQAPGRNGKVDPLPRLDGDLHRVLPWKYGAC